MLALQKEIVTEISAGYMHSAVITQEGGLYMWGDNRDSRIFKQVKTYKNSNRHRNYAVPQFCSFFADKKVKQVSCGTTHSLVLTQSGEVFAAGSNEFG